MTVNCGRDKFLRSLQASPIIAAVKDAESLDIALQSSCEIVFTLSGDVCSIEQTTQKIKNAGKIAIVHIDLIDGLASRDVAVKFIKQYTPADGIISTKANLVRAAHEIKMIAIQRCFLIDSIAMETFKKLAASGHADAVEILPGVMPKIIRKITSFCNIPLIVGGLVQDKEDIMTGLENGAMAVSSTNSRIWDML